MGICHYNKNLSLKYEKGTIQFKLSTPFIIQFNFFNIIMNNNNPLN